MQRRNRGSVLLGALMVVWNVGSAMAAPPAPGTAPIVPRPLATGFSTIEQRYVYAPPDKGRIEIPLSLGTGAPNEVFIQEPVMCQEQARAKVTIDYDKAANTVRVRGKFHKSLPYRMSYTRPVDVSTQYNQFPVSVTNGKWQIWIVGRMLFESTFYYDAATLQLIGNEADFPAGPPPNSIPVPVPTIQMLCTPMFEGNPQGDATIDTTYRYDQMLDMLGSGGTYVAFLPYNLCKPDEYGPYYVNGGLHPSRAMSFDQILASIWEGTGMAISTSLEPDPKPSFLDGRDNTMIGWGGSYPAQIPSGYSVQPISGLIQTMTSCQTHIEPKFPPAYFNICGG
ncbi:MAG: hypothetical protein ABTQ32_15405 [Myxococcaceae bacterium]